jgi:ferritin-like metal-binding protein YciE
MPDLTVLDEKLAEVLGLAQAAGQAGKRVATLARKEKDADLVSLMDRMVRDSGKIAEQCEKVAGTRDGLKTAITRKARETKAEVTDFMKTYLEDADALDGLEFLSMAEAGELAHWEILATLNDTAGDKAIAKLVSAALPVERGHVAAVREHALRLAAEEDPSEEA